MKTITLTIFFSMILSVGFCQTQKQTEEFIEIKSKELELQYSRVNKKCEGTDMPHTVKMYELIFYKDYLIIEQYNNMRNDRNCQLILPTYDYFILKINEIKSFEFERNIEPILPYLFQHHIIIKSNKYNFYAINNLKNKEVAFQIIDSKFNTKYILGKTDRINVDFENYNEETVSKIKKAFKHLVGLYGGKIIDDMF